MTEEGKVTGGVSFIPFLPGYYLRDSIFLALICISGFGIYLVYDMPAAVGLDLKTYSNMSNEDFMFTFYRSYFIFRSLKQKEEKLKTIFFNFYIL